MEPIEERERNRNWTKKIKISKLQRIKEISGKHKSISLTKLFLFLLLSLEMPNCRNYDDDDDVLISVWIFLFFFSLLFYIFWEMMGWGILCVFVYRYQPVRLRTEREENAVG